MNDISEDKIGSSSMEPYECIFLLILSKNSLNVTGNWYLFPQVWFFSQQIFPFSLGFVFGPIFMRFGNVSSHYRLLPIFSSTDSTDIGLDFDMMVHAMVI